MSLKFNAKRTFKFDQTNEDGTLDFSITCKMGTVEDILGEGDYMQRVAQVLRKSIISWEGIVDEDGVIQPVTEDTQRIVFNYIVNDYPDLFVRMQEAFTEVNAKKK